METPQSKWKVNTPLSTPNRTWKKKPPSPPSAHPQENKGRTLHSTTSDFSLVAWKYYS